MWPGILFLEEDFRFRLDGIEEWAGDGIIADFDHPEVCKSLSGMKLPIVAVGGSYEDEAQYPEGIAYVATDNRLLVEQAWEHLVESGLNQFACYSLPESPLNRWAQEGGCFPPFDGPVSFALPYPPWPGDQCATWNGAVHQLMDWLQALPKPIGIIAVTDARARQLLQACIMAGITVPEEVAIVGIDNDTLGQHLTRIPLTSVSQGTQEMGQSPPGCCTRCWRAAVFRPRESSYRPRAFKSASPVAGRSPTGPASCGRCSTSGSTPQGIKTEQVAGYLRLSRSSIEASFRKELGRTVHDEIMAYKLARAKSLLEETPMSTAEVAQVAGFGTIQYLNTVSIRELGCTPGAYRTATRAQASAKAIPP